ncbi:MAG TPA: glycoside hydrolase family 43 protein [Acidimicrobiales bacterium]|nr:glycoside hydrolase family 43 protein [Acidimicrobiales bacterium]
MSLRTAFRERRPFPGQDPWVVEHDGSLLLVQAAGRNSTIVVKRFHDLARMDRNVQTVIWPPGGRNGRLRQLWAPELHHIDGRWYVYYSAGDGRPGSHRSYALVADDPLGPYGSLGPVHDPANDVWAIDLTVFRHDGRLYALWSGWDGPADGFPQNLYVAPMDNPWTIGGQRRCVSSPRYPWEMTVAPVNEGPQAFRHPATDRLFVLYAADASWTQAYKTGLLEWTGGDVIDPAAWRKHERPLFTGGGHGCVVDTAGGSHLVYHRKVSGDPGWADREILSAPLDWDAAGRPVVLVGARGGAAASPSTAGLVHLEGSPPSPVPDVAPPARSGSPPR